MASIDAQLREAATCPHCGERWIEEPDAAGELQPVCVNRCCVPFDLVDDDVVARWRELGLLDELRKVTNAAIRAAIAATRH